MNKDNGADWVILGHLDRNTKDGEKDIVSKKMAHALEAGLKVIACLGDTPQVREVGKTEEGSEATASTSNNWSNVVFAFEPVWGCGSGKTASPQLAQHGTPGGWLSSNALPNVGPSAPTQNSGSVTGADANDLPAGPGLHGIIVGGENVEPEVALHIVNAFKLN